MSEHHDSALAKAALCMAAAIRGGDVAGVVFHRDKGGEYIGDLFAGACTSLAVTPSTGRVGSALDNAAAESFNSTLEHELLSRRRFATNDQARRAVVRFIDAYNHRRRHSRCHMLPPVAYETLLAERGRGRPGGAGRVTPASDRARDPTASACGQMRDFMSCPQPSTVSGEGRPFPAPGDAWTGVQTRRLDTGRCDLVVLGSA